MVAGLSDRFIRNASGLTGGCLVSACWRSHRSKFVFAIDNADALVDNVMRGTAHGNAKRLARTQQPDLYLELKWLR